MSESPRPQSSPATPASPSGLLVIDKPLGLTSMDVCRRVRWRLVQGGAPKRVKVGHGGTLDPLATGLLVILVGKATRLCDAVMAGRKTYEASVDFSATSTTDDAEGERTPVTPPRVPTRADLDAVLPRFLGVIQQRPPAYSAMKVGGHRAYDLARAGKPPELSPRPVTVHSIRVDVFDWPAARLTIDCGKGTYIRSLARDLGAAMSAGGYLTALRRTAVGHWTIDQARTIESLPEKMGQADLMGAALE